MVVGQDACTSATRPATSTALQRAQRRRQLDLSRKRRGQGRTRVRRRQAVLRRLRRPRLRVNASNGHQVWAVGTNGASFGFGSGNFYSTPAVAFGRVYMGNTDGLVYSFAARTGAARLGDRDRGVCLCLGGGGRTPRGSARRSTSAPTTATSTRSTPQSGAVRWSHPAGGRISGSATIVDNVVYYSDLGDEDDDRPQRAHRPAGVHVPRRSLQPGGRGRTRDVPGRLQRALRAAAEDAGRPTAASPRQTTRTTGRRSILGRRSREAAITARKPDSVARNIAFAPEAAILLSLCVVEVEVIVRNRPSRAVGSARMHAAELDRMRDELKDAAAARIGRGRPKRSSTCCRPGCYEPRVPPAAYCDACSAAGYVEEAA